MTSERPRIYADFLKRDDLGRVLLTTRGTQEGLAAAGTALAEGQRLLLYADDALDDGERDDLIARATVCYDREADRWVAELQQEPIHESSAE